MLLWYVHLKDHFGSFLAQDVDGLNQSHVIASSLESNNRHVDEN